MPERLALMLQCECFKKRKVRCSAFPTSEKCCSNIKGGDVMETGAVIEIRRHLSQTWEEGISRFLSWERAQGAAGRTLSDYRDNKSHPVLTPLPYGMVSIVPKMPGGIPIAGRHSSFGPQYEAEIPETLLRIHREGRSLLRITRRRIQVSPEGSSKYTNKVWHEFSPAIPINGSLNDERTLIFSHSSSSKMMKRSAATRPSRELKDTEKDITMRRVSLKVHFMK